MKGDYEMISSDELHELEDSIEKVKKSVNNSDMVVSMKGLHESINALKNMFEKANEELTFEQKESKIIQEQLKPVMAKLSEITDQNETIASALVKVSEHTTQLRKDISELKGQVSLASSSMSSPSPRSSPSYNSSSSNFGSSFTAPPPQPSNDPFAAPPPIRNDTPPPIKKTSLFSK